MTESEKYFFLSDNFFEISTVLTRCHIANHTPTDDRLDKCIDPNDFIFKASEPQALDYLAALLSTLEILKGKQYDRFCKFVLANKASEPISVFNEGIDGLSRR